jgi:hypothetical protein
MKVIFNKRTRFYGLSRRMASLVIIITAVLVGYGVFLCQPGLETRKGKGVDLDCYRAIAIRIHGGEGYYTAAGEELRSRGYPTRSLFNWRMPLLATLIGHLPTINTGKIVAVLLASIASLTWISILMRYLPSFGWRIFGSLLVISPIIYSLSGDVFLAHEFWAGTLIALSLAAYVKEWRFVAVGSGLAALFLRELSLPFVAVMALIDLAERKRRQALAWLIGIMVFGVEMYFHWLKIPGMDTNVVNFKEGWVVFGGWSFVLNASRMDPYLLLAPPWVTAVILPLLLLGFLGWKDELGLRVGLTVGVYVAAFLFVGLPFSQYWGMMYSSVMLLGLLNIPYTVNDLWGSIRQKPKAEKKIILDPGV